MYMKHGKVKFGYKDSWSAEPVLSDLVVNWLSNFRDVLISRQEKEYVTGVPSAVMNNMFSTDNYTDEEMWKGLSEWISRLDTMIYAFRNEEPCHDFKWVDGPEHNYVCEQGLIRWNKIPDDESAYNSWKEQCEQHRQKVELGRMLFAEHYDDLWW